jgi:hypothetical protein
MNDQIIFERAKFWTYQGILFCEIRNNDISINLNMETIKNYIEAILSLCNNQAMPFLIDLRDTKGAYVNSAAKLLATSPEIQKVRLVEIFVTNSMSIKLLINSYKRLFNPSTPFMIFNNYDEAVEYCVEIKNS